MKKKINLDEIIEKTEIPKEIVKLIEEDGILEFFDYNKIREVEEVVSNAYQVAELDLLGKKYGIIMKDSLVSALLDPQANDANTLIEAWKKVNDKLISSYGKKQLKPLETNIEKTLFKNYVNALLMNLVKYPADELNEETLKELGLYNKNISKLYVNAAAAWLGTNEGIEKIIKSKDLVSKIDKIGYTGTKENVNLSVETCHAGSHYVLKPQLSAQQIDVQIEIPQITEEYTKIEDKIVDYILKNATNEQIRDNARNLVRLYLNLSTLYEKGKPLPLEFS